MEHETSALVIPETDPLPHAPAKFLLFFEQLSFYLPSEPDGAGTRPNDLFPGPWSGYAPAPLGRDLPRFNRLLRELETSRPEEFARWFSAAKGPGATGMVRDEDEDETSAAGVYTALHKDAAARSAILRKERLWQARLILKLAELLDRRELEVRQGLARVSTGEQKIFASLEGSGAGDTDDPPESSGPGKLLHPDAYGQQAHASSLQTTGQFCSLRLKAWAELYLTDPSERQHLALAAANPECGAIILDGYENTWRREAEKLFSLAVPRFSSMDAKEGWDRFQASRNAFRETARENLEYLAGFLRETAGLTVSSTDGWEKPALLAENVAAWNEKISTHFPGAANKGARLDFYSFPGVQCSRLFQRLFNLERPSPVTKSEHPTGILAVLKP